MTRESGFNGAVRGEPVNVAANDHAWLSRLLDACHRALDDTAARANEPLMLQLRADLQALCRRLEAELEAQRAKT